MSVTVLKKNISIFKAEFEDFKSIFKRIGDSAMLRAIRMCLRTTDANADNIPWLLVSLGCVLGTNFTSGIISLLYQKVYQTTF